MTTTMMGIVDDEVSKETPPLSLPLFPTDALLHILSFVYQCKNCPGGTAGSNIVALIRSHNDLHCLYTTWPFLRPILRVFAQQESFLSVANAHSCPFAHCLKIIQHADVQSYQCSGDTPRHEIHNLLRQHKDKEEEEEEQEPDWNNTWYDPTLRLDLNPYYAQLWLRQPVKLLAYGITNARDNRAGRDPKNWRLLVTRRTGPEIGHYHPYQKFTVAHSVQNHQFQQRHETFWHVLDPPVVDSLVTTIRLAIDETWVENQGAQIAQLYLVVVESD